MKRRDLIKSSLATLGAGTIALSGCSKNDTSFDEIIPKQTAQYEFSAPLPFDFKIIDEMSELNSEIKKSQLKMLYNNIPIPMVNRFRGWIHESRGKGNDSIKTLDDFGKYVKYAYDKGFEFTYLMNSPHPTHGDEFSYIKDDFKRLVEYLHKIGVKNIKVGNNQTVYLLNEFAPNEFKLQVSACYDLHGISQYKNLFNMFPDFNLINIAHDEIHNFELFKGLRELYPDKKIEVLVNERCIKGCSAFASHTCRRECLALYDDSKTKMNTFVKATYVYPWDLKYYSACGVNNFKFVPHSPYPRSNFSNLTALKKLLTIVENGYENYTLQDLFDADWIMPNMFSDKNKDIKLSEIAPLFPGMKYFAKHANRCASDCETKCNYCFECAKELEKVLV